jgi:hypothetical protein
MAEPKAKKITMTALKYHTHAGKEHQAGDTYDVDEDQVANLSAQGMAKPSDEVESEAKDAKASAKGNRK